MMSPEIEAARSELVERLMLTDPSYDDSFDRIVRLLRAISGTSAAAFTVLDGGRQFFKAHEGVANRSTPRDVSFCTHTIEEPGMLVVRDAREDERFWDSPLVCGPGGHCFYAGVPVRAPSGLPLGALCILDEQPRELGERERIALQDLGGVLEESLMLRSLSVIDPLTSLFNRRHFEELVTREWSRGFSAQEPLALFMIDIDHFKKYNDTYGHAAGDICLRQVASTLRIGARRVGDILARIGGEEFVILLPNTSSEEALGQAQQIRAALAALEIPHQASPLGRVTLSIGVAIIEETGSQTLAQATQRADLALYKAKADGRDRAVLATPQG